ncbi:hypothetical protein, partial [Tychonema sp. LEGE 06208]|uniref:hypothetical protein n=1 Tax=Tychonema sp. LEGE 06208 TaxID=1828663 RepID=UPI001D146759
MPYAQCPMPNALCPMPYARQYLIFRLKGYIYKPAPRLLTNQKPVFFLNLSFIAAKIRRNRVSSIPMRPRLKLSEDFA